MVSGAAGSVPDGDFTGKMIVLSNLHDTEAYPWQGNWYLEAARGHLGEKTDQHIRLWYTDRAAHGDVSDRAMVGYTGDPTITTQVVSYLVAAGVAGCQRLGGRRNSAAIHEHSHHRRRPG